MPVLVVWFVLRRLIGVGLIIVGTWGVALEKLLAIASVIAFALLLLSTYLMATGEPGIHVGLCVGIIGNWLAAWVAGKYAWPAGRALLTPSYWEASRGSLRPILLLRSFMDDGLVTPFDFGSSFHQHVNQVITTGAAGAMRAGVAGYMAGKAIGSVVGTSIVRRMYSSESFEEVLVAYLKHYGPVVAISRPGQLWRPAGAARLAVKGNGEEWKGVVADLLRRSSLVFMIVGKTPGVTWEVNEVISRKLAAKLWLLFPPGGPGEVAERWGLFRDRLLASGVRNVPDTLEDNTVLLQFDGSWNCQPRSAQSERESYLRLMQARAKAYFGAEAYLTPSERLRPVVQAAKKCLLVLVWGIILVLMATFMNWTPPPRK